MAIKKIEKYFNYFIITIITGIRTLFPFFLKTIDIDLLSIINIIQILLIKILELSIGEKMVKKIFIDSWENDTFQQINDLYKGNIPFFMSKKICVMIEGKEVEFNLLSFSFSLTKRLTEEKRKVNKLACRHFFKLVLEKDDRNQYIRTVERAIKEAIITMPEEVYIKYKKEESKTKAKVKKENHVSRKATKDKKKVDKIKELGKPKEKKKVDKIKGLGKPKEKKKVDKPKEINIKKEERDMISNGLLTNQLGERIIKNALDKDGQPMKNLATFLFTLEEYYLFATKKDVAMIAEIMIKDVIEGLSIKQS